MTKHLTVFHGSVSMEIEPGESLEGLFNDELIGKGGDANSALGLHTSFSRWVAIEYAENLGRITQKLPVVYEISVPVNRITCLLGTSEYLGMVDGERVLTHKDFSAIRSSMIKSGIDAVVVEGCEDIDPCVLLQPSKCSVISRYTADTMSLRLEAGEIAEESILPKGIEWVSGGDFLTPEELMSNRLAAAPAPN
ncbi:hypothetical protein ACFOY8_12345 [Thalassospira xianhensis]|nr:hypothetical protein [Thalassospira xianhensis]